MELTESRFEPSEGPLAVLRYLIDTAGIEFDATLAAKAYRQAIREVSPSESLASRKRLASAAAALGANLLARSMSIRDALEVVRTEMPFAVFSVTRSGSGQWFVLLSGGKTGRLKSFQPGCSEIVGGPAELAAELGAADAEVLLEWYIAVPASPMSSASAEPVELEIAEPHGTHDAHGSHEHSGHLSPFRRLLGLLAPEMSDLWIVLLFAIGVGILTLATPVVAMAVVNTVALGTLLQQLLVLCVALFIALGLAAVLQYLQSVIVEFIQRRVFVRVAADLAYRLPRVAVSAFDRQHGPELVNRFFDVLTVQKASATLLLDGVTIALQMLIGLMLLGFYHVYLLGFDMALITSLVFLVFVLGRGAVRTAIRESIAKYAVAGWMEEMARHPVAFKTAGGPELAAERTDLLVRSYLQARTEHFVVLVRQGVFALFLQAVANVALLAIGGILVIRGELTLGELVAAEIVVTLVVATFAKLGKQFAAYYDLLAAVEKLGHLIDLPLERADGEAYHPQASGAAVAFHDVSFTYAGAHRSAVARFSFRIEPGERVALTGPNGAGKSTLVDLLLGLRLPESGWVEVDGADIRSLRLDSLRENVAVVKGLELIEASVAENVRMGRESVTLTDVRHALRRVGLLETVLGLPDGTNTRLWSTGSPLSMGQANRLMLARAIVGRPRLLVLDEALDHMDSDVREAVLPELLGPDAARTLLVVSHSEEVVRLCDRVIELSRHEEVTAAH